MWIILTRVRTHYGVDVRSRFIHNTMNPDGGKSKINFLLSPEMLQLGESDNTFVINGKPALAALLIAMKHTVADRYIIQSSKKDPDPEIKKIDPSSIARGHQDVPANFPMAAPKGFLKDHRVVVGVFKEALEITHWPLDDKAEKQEIQLPKLEQARYRCGSKRSRSEFDSSQPADDGGGDHSSSKRHA